jgi:hypothetical protein
MYAHTHTHTHIHMMARKPIRVIVDVVSIREKTAIEAVNDRSRRKKKSYLRNCVEMLRDGTPSLSSSERNEMRECIFTPQQSYIEQTA